MVQFFMPHSVEAETSRKQDDSKATESKIELNIGLFHFSKN